MFEKQVVYLSQTMSGRPGLFTGRTMAVPLRPEEAASIDAARAVALRMGFEFDEQTSAERWAELARDGVQGMARVVNAMQEHTRTCGGDEQVHALICGAP